MDESLLSIWREINAKFFSNSLKELADIAWLEIGGDNGIGAHGMYRHKSRCIIIDCRFEPEEDALKLENPTALLKLEISYRLMLHEMVHQALHERGAASPGQHGAAFLQEATRISALMDHPTPTEENVSRWPLAEMFEQLAAVTAGEADRDGSEKS